MLKIIWNSAFASTTEPWWQTLVGVLCVFAVPAIIGVLLVGFGVKP